MRYLFLDHNYLVGEIPLSIAHEDSSLEDLWLQHNLLSGTIIAELSILPKLKNLYIDGNKFTGSVPQDLCRENLNANLFEFSTTIDYSKERDYCNSIACPKDTYSEKGVFPCFFMLS